MLPPMIHDPRLEDLVPSCGSLKVTSIVGRGAAKVSPGGKVDWAASRGLPTTGLRARQERAPIVRSTAPCCAQTGAAGHLARVRLHRGDWDVQSPS